MAGSDETGAIVLSDVVTCVYRWCARLALASMFQAFYPHPSGFRPSIISHHTHTSQRSVRNSHILLTLYSRGYYICSSQLRESRRAGDLLP
jgi:hypothetical protein